MIRLSTVLILLCILSPAGALSDTFSEQGLEPAVVIVRTGDGDVLDRVRGILDREGAGLQFFPPSAFFLYAGPGIESALAGLPASVERDPEGLADAELGAIARRALAGRLAPAVPPAPLDIDPDYVRRMLGNDILHHDPDVISKLVPKREGPSRASARELVTRAPNQNSELLIGTVVINIIFAESEGPVENWTDDEIADALVAISAGLSDYQQKANWAGGVEFTILYEDYVRAGTSWEPILQGNMDEDRIWIAECFVSIGMDPMYGAYYNAHLLNEQKRNEYNTDWAFTAIVVDASENGCWQHENAPYVAYSYLGGPYLLIPYPACRFGAADGFSHVFDHEMGHTFWTLDEYQMSPGNCGALSGYLAIANENAHSCYNDPDKDQLPCIMNNRELTRPLPICMFTLGQMGLWDGNENNIPDVYEMPPTVEFRSIPGIPADTVFEDGYVMAARAYNDAVQNRNVYDWEEIGAQRFHYAPHFVRGWYWLNTGLTEDLTPTDKGWDESTEDFGFIFRGLEPGYNILHIGVENHVGMKAQATDTIYFVGLRYYQAAVEVELGYHDISWKTAEEVFGAVFDIHRRDLSTGGADEIIASITESASVGANRRHFVYRDDDIEAGHDYRYRIEGSFQVDEEHGEIVESTAELVATAMMPLADHLASHVVPNPTTGNTSFTVNVPRTFYDPTNNTSRVVAAGGDIRLAPSVTEVRTTVDIGVYDVSGRRVATVYNMLRFGGPMTITWDGIDRNGRAVSPGVYFMRIKAGNDETTRKLVVIR